MHHRITFSSTTGTGASHRRTGRVRVRVVVVGQGVVVRQRVAVTTRTTVVVVVVVAAVVSIQSRCVGSGSCSCSGSCRGVEECFLQTTRITGEKRRRRGRHMYVSGIRNQQDPVDSRQWNGKIKKKKEKNQNPFSGRRSATIEIFRACPINRMCSVVDQSVEFDSPVRLLAVGRHVRSTVT